MDAGSCATPRPCSPALAEDGGAFISAISVHEAEARTLGLTGDALRTWRQDNPPLRAEPLRWVGAGEPTLAESDALAKTSRPQSS